MFTFYHQDSRSRPLSDPGLLSAHLSLPPSAHEEETIAERQQRLQQEAKMALAQVLELFSFLCHVYASMSFFYVTVYKYFLISCICHSLTVSFSCYSLQVFSLCFHFSVTFYGYFLLLSCTLCEVYVTITAIFFNIS